MQLEADGNYVKSIRDYVTSMKDRYENGSVLLIAKNSKDFRQQLENFMDQSIRDDNLVDLANMYYPENEQEEFLNNLDLKDYTPYYWTYNEKNYVVRCIFLDELKVFFENGDHNKIHFIDELGREYYPDDFAKIFLKLLCINDGYLKTINNISTISFPMVLFNVLPYKIKCYILSTVYTKNRKFDRYARIRLLC